MNCPCCCIFQMMKTGRLQVKELWITESDIKPLMCCSPISQKSHTLCFGCFWQWSSQEKKENFGFQVSCTIGDIQTNFKLFVSSERNEFQQLRLWNQRLRMSFIQLNCDKMISWSSANVCLHMTWFEYCLKKKKFAPICSTGLTALGFGTVVQISFSWGIIKYLLQALEDATVNR